MPALATVVSDYLTAVKDALTTGTDTGSNMNAAAQNYLRAQDMATVLDLLQEALTQTTPLTAVGGSTTTVVDGASTFVAGTQVGNTVTIVTATQSIVGETSVVISNTTTTLTVFPAFSATLTNLDTYTIEATMLDAVVADLRGGKGVADATPGDPYYTNRSAIAGIMLGVQRLGGTLQARNIGRPGLETAAGSTDTEVVLVTSGVPYRIDELRGMNLIVAGEQRIISSNTEDTATLKGALSSAPGAAAGVIITVPIRDFGGTSAPKIVTHPGAQPGENRVLADFIDQLQTLVVAFVLPT